MDDIVLSAGVRQNLLALQSTAHLMSLTQNRLATGKKVNTAEDNPISFFTAQSLQSRAGDFNSLLDSIGQAQQVLSTANQGITSLSKLVQSGISTARQAQQSPIGYTTKSNSRPPSAAPPRSICAAPRPISARRRASNVLFTGTPGGTHCRDREPPRSAAPCRRVHRQPPSTTTRPRRAAISAGTALYGPAGGGAGTGGLTTRPQQASPTARPSRSTATPSRSERRGSGCGLRSDRLWRQRQHRHRRQRQLDRLSRHRHAIDRHCRRRSERDRSRQRRAERRHRLRHGHDHNSTPVQTSAPISGGGRSR